MLIVEQMALVWRQCGRR